MATRAWRLVGRRDELRRIALLRRQGSGGVVLVGEAGVGKTRVAVEALAEAQASGSTTVRLTATRAAAAIPLGALAPVLPELREGVNPLVAGRQALRARAGDGPLVILVDDAHLLDDISATLMLQVAANGEAFVVMTVRSGERVPEPVTAMWKDGHAERLELRGLTDDLIVELVIAILGGEVALETTDALRRAARGNPLAVRELVLAATEDGSLCHDDDGWRLKDTLPFSARLTEVIEQRVGALSAAETAALELVAVGEPLDVSLLDGLVSPMLVGALEGRGLLDVRGDGRRLEAWLAHPFHGDALRKRMSPLRRRTLLISLADAIEASGAHRPGDLLRVAAWRVDAGVPCAPELLLEAAARSTRALSWETAARLARAAWDQEPSWSAGALLGLVLLRLDRHAEANAVFAAIAPLAPDDHHRVQAAALRAEALHRGLGDERAAKAVLDEVRATISDPDAGADLVTAHAIIDLYEGDVTGGLAAVEPLLDDPTGRAYLPAAFVASFALIYDGQTDRARRLAQQAFEVHTKVWDHDLLHDPPDIHLAAIAQALVEAGAYEDAETVVAAERAAAIERGDQRGIAWCDWTLGRIRLEQGRIREAARALRAGAERSGTWIGRRMMLGELTTALALGGDLSGARVTASRCGEITSRSGDGWVVEGRAWLAVAGGDLATARALLEQGATEALDAGQRAIASRLLHTLARLGDPAAAASWLQDIAAGTESPMIAARAVHAQALVGRDPARLEAAAEEFEAMGALLLAAEAWADASRAWRRAGAPRRGAAAVHRSQTLAGECEGARTPALLALESPTPLTEREREVALLAAQGRANRAIAGLLYLSERTVENHLQRIYTKLGVKGRNELSPALGINAG